MAGRRSISTMPPAVQDIADSLAELGISADEWEYLDRYQVPPLGQNFQIRDSSSLAPDREASLYAENMRRGAKFPPLLLSADDVVLDGGTRQRALWKNTDGDEVPYFHVVRLREPYHFNDQTTAMTDRFTIIAAKLNGKHGRRLSDKNMQRVIESLMRQDYTLGDMAKMLGCSVQTVRNVVNARKGVNRLEMAGVSPKGLSATHLGIIATKGREFYDEPLKEAVHLAKAAKFTGPQLRSMLGELSELHDPGAQMEVLKGVREEHKLQVDGIVTTNTLATKADNRMSFFLDYADDPGLLVTTGGNEARKRQLERVLGTMKVLRVMAGVLDKPLQEA